MEKSLVESTEVSSLLMFKLTLVTYVEKDLVSPYRLNNMIVKI
jgi:hypothetical protein